MSDTCGRSWLTPLAYYVPDESSSRTWLVTSLWGWTPFSGILPRWGMTRRGELYELPTPALPTAEHACSSLLPTPLNADGGGPRGSSAGWGLRNVSRELLPTPVTEPQTGNGHARNLGKEVQLLPTPDAYQGTRGGSQAPEKRLAGGHSVSLQDVTEHLLGTPRSVLWKAGTMSATREGIERNGYSARLEEDIALLPTPTTQTGGAATRSGDRGDEMLLPAVARAAVTGALLPTPTAQAAKHSTDDRGPGTLDDYNLWTVAPRLLATPRASRGASTTENFQALTGEPTDPPSPAGLPFSDDPRPDPLSLDEQESA